MQAVELEQLDTVDVRFRALASCCVMLASGGYPASYKTGFPITGLSQLPEAVSVFHSGTALKDGALVTSGGRVLGITALADTLPQAIERAYDAVAKIQFEGMHYRRDIGKKATN
jgi:phosphoribosylamine--glycine ligase